MVVPVVTLYPDELRRSRQTPKKIFSASGGVCGVPLRQLTVLMISLLRDCPVPIRGPGSNSAAARDTVPARDVRAKVRKSPPAPTASFPTESHEECLFRPTRTPQNNMVGHFWSAFLRFGRPCNAVLTPFPTEKCQNMPVLPRQT